MENSFETKLVKIDELITENLQIRVAMNEECIEDYAAGYRETPEKMPPVVVYYDAMLDKHYLADGFHRVAAAKLNGSDTITAEVREGTFDDALREALKANATNGLRRTNADKHHALEIAWANWNTLYANIKRTTPDGRPSSRQLAEICCVHHETANKFIKLSRVSKFDTPRTSAITGEATNCHVGKSNDATKITDAHTEVRNAKARQNLKQGLDQFGVEIPARLLPAFKSTQLTVELRSLRGVLKAIRKAHEHGDMEFAAVGQGTLVDLSNVIEAVKLAKPFCVCRFCRGTGCDFCSRRGFQTVMQYRRLPSEYMHHED